MDNEKKRPSDPCVVSYLIWNKRRLARSVEADRPLTGIYWWIPIPGANGSEDFDWEVQPFYGKDLFHDTQWDKLLEILSEHWKKRLSSQTIEYAALPRGRVNRPYQERLPALYHGDDSPGELAAPRAAFNLPESAKTVYDDHERMLSVDQWQMIDALGMDLGLEVPGEDDDDNSEGDWE